MERRGVDFYTRMYYVKEERKINFVLLYLLLVKATREAVNVFPSKYTRVERGRRERYHPRGESYP